jgi:hypothetical protein
MLKKAQIALIASLAKIPVETLQAAIDAKEEQEITIAEGLTSLSPDEITTLGKNKYEEGKTAGSEMIVKDYAKTQGLDYKGNKLDGLIKAAQEKALTDAGKSLTDKEKEFNERIATLQGTVTEYTGKLTAAEARAAEMQLNGELWKHIPAIGEDGVKIGNDAIINLMKAEGYSFKQENGKTSVYRDGQLQQDKLSNPLPLKDVFTGFMKEKNILTEAGAPPAGRGGKNSVGTGKATKLSELSEQFTAAGKSLNGAEFNQAVRKAREENKEFDMNA